MSYQLWLQYNSEKKEQFQNCNRPLIDFLKVRASRLIPIIGDIIRLQVVDTSKPSDIKQAAARGITSLPTLIVDKQSIIGLSKIEQYLDGIIKQGSVRQPGQAARRKRGGGGDGGDDDDYAVGVEGDDGISRPARRTGEEDEIEQMWRSEIVDNSDEDDMGDDDANDRMARAEAMTARRKALAEKNEGGGRRRGKAKGASQGRTQARRPPARTRGNTPEGNADNDDMEEREQEAPPSSRRKAGNTKGLPPPPPARGGGRQRKKDNVEGTPAEISRSLGGGDAEGQRDDALMSKFWENQESTSY